MKIIDTINKIIDTINKIIIKKKTINQGIKTPIASTEDDLKPNFISKAFIIPLVKMSNRVFRKKDVVNFAQPSPVQRTSPFGDNHQKGIEELTQQQNDNIINSDEPSKLNWFQRSWIRLKSVFITNKDKKQDNSENLSSTSSNHIYDKDEHLKPSISEQKVNENLNTEHSKEVISMDGDGDQDTHFTLDPLPTEEDNFSISTTTSSQEKKSGIFNTVVNMLTGIKNFFVDSMGFAQDKFNNAQDVTYKDVNERIVNSQKPANAEACSNGLSSQTSIQSYTTSEYETERVRDSDFDNDTQSTTSFTGRFNGESSKQVDSPSSSLKKDLTLDNHKTQNPETQGESITTYKS
ncbi:hypothetical protein [Wolbachia endosymbiont of Chironomus riparius]|uniref:hypothetical protein n=1 Tax=Wolbachia endosymbiont of Chironomus riparius TaxID=2883238 RepID=UPI00209E7586|nr:hypothetical protein [Wolbachia endosymbiont of Chironomus riparius]